MEKSSSLKAKNYYMIGGAILGIAALFYFLKKGSGATPLIEDSTTTVDETQPLPVAIDQSKMLLKGSRGLEVVELQKLMGITSDGIFGIQTENRLLQLKGVKSISLNGYKSSITINQNALPIGTRIMANLRPDVQVYKAIQKADGSFYSDYSVTKRIPYGEFAGTIKGKNAAGTWYLVTATDLFGGEDKLIFRFVKVTDVVKI